MVEETGLPCGVASMGSPGFPEEANVVLTSWSTMLMELLGLCMSARTLSLHGVIACSTPGKCLKEETLQLQSSSPQGHINTLCSYHTAILSGAGEFHKQT